MTLSPKKNQDERNSATALVGWVAALWVALCLVPYLVPSTISFNGDKPCLGIAIADRAETANKNC